ncbi:MAG: DinB family protein [Chloroflexi bacterium]|nr:DinB family protein [Chloroflexota bacterium]
MKEVVAWLRETHATLMAYVLALTEDDLLRPRRANWDEQRETRWLLSMPLQHDTYHAGVINHLRSLLHGDDRWRWQQMLSVE